MTQTINEKRVPPPPGSTWEFGVELRAVAQGKVICETAYANTLEAARAKASRRLKKQLQTIEAAS